MTIIYYSLISVCHYSDKFTFTYNIVFTPLIVFDLFKMQEKQTIHFQIVRCTHDYVLREK